MLIVIKEDEIIIYWKMGTLFELGLMFELIVDKTQLLWDGGGGVWPGIHFYICSEFCV